MPGRRPTRAEAGGRRTASSRKPVGAVRSHAYGESLCASRTSIRAPRTCAARCASWAGSAGVQWRTLLAATCFGVLWMVTQALFPAAMQRAIDQGIVAGDRRPAAALVRRARRARRASAPWPAPAALVRRDQLAARRLPLASSWSAGTAPTPARPCRAQMPTGEVVAAVASDAMRLGGALRRLRPDRRRRSSATSSSPSSCSHARAPLGLVVLVGVPVLVALLAFIVRPLQRRQAAPARGVRPAHHASAPTPSPGCACCAASAASRPSCAGTRSSRSGCAASGTGVAGDPGGARRGPGAAARHLRRARHLARRPLRRATGEITAGELVAFYGYSAFLVMPLRTATEFVDRVTRAHIGAAQDRSGSSRCSPTTPTGRRRPGDRAAPTALPAHRPASAASSSQPGLLTAVVSARPEESAALADRLGRFGRGRRRRSGWATSARRPAAGDRPPPGRRQRDRPAAVHRHAARRARPVGPLRRRRASCATLSVASGEDVLEALADGLDSEVEERGRSFSGGQRQRLALARALLTDAETLVLVEPTSAVDAHTEARIAGPPGRGPRGAAPPSS